MSLLTLLLRCAFYKHEKEFLELTTFKEGLDKFTSLTEEKCGKDYGLMRTLSLNYEQFESFLANPCEMQFVDKEDGKEYNSKLFIHDQTGIQSFILDLVCKSKNKAEGYFHVANLALIDKVLKNV